MAGFAFEDLKPGDYQAASISGGLPKLLRIWEYLRKLNTGGYGGGRLVSMKNGPAKAGKGVTSCSPFTATAVYMALDPREVDTGQAYSLDGPYDPQFDGGQALGPYFYYLHNGFSLESYKSNKSWKADFKRQYVDRIPRFDEAFKFINHSAGSIVAHNLGEPVETKKIRRGDLLGIDWHNNHGHAVFCWNVHLDAKGDVDCFQFVSSNGTASGGAGITVFRYPYVDPAYLDHQGSQYIQKKEMFSLAVDDPQAYPDYVKAPYWWFGVPGVKKGSIDLESFGVPAKLVQIAYADTLDTSVHEIHAARLFGVTPPEPYLRADGAKPAGNGEPAKPPPVATVKSKKGEAAPPAKRDGPAPGVATAPARKTEKAPAPADPHPGQVEAEKSLQALWQARWIEADPGQADEVNDKKSQAAIRDYQEKFMGGKAPSLGHADPETRKRLATSAAAALMMPLVNASLQALFQKGKLKARPGANPAQLDAETKAAVKEFQKSSGLAADGIPGKGTQEKLAAAVKKLQVEPAPQKKEGEKIFLMVFYWTRNHAAPGERVFLRALCAPADEGKSCKVGLFQGDKELVAEAGTLTFSGFQASAEIALPQGLSAGTILQAKIEDAGASGVTQAPLYVDGKKADGAPAEAAEWRPYIGKAEVPAEVLEAVRRNRARYPAKALKAVTGKYAGDHHYDYKPPDSHAQWAKGYFQKKADAAQGVDRMVARAFGVLLDLEGRPASLQTYDNQIVTWGVGLGAKGDGVHAFEEMNKDAGMKKLLDGLGINYEKGDYQVVDLAAKKVVSSAAGQKGDDNRHLPPLKSWRQQVDLLSAIIGISEDEATREAVAESQYAVYLSNSTRWPGKDKVFTVALFVMIVHMHHWMPAIAKYGFNVEKEFQAVGGGTPSVETDKKLAPRIANAYVRYARDYFVPKGKKDSYDDVRDRTKRKLWAEMRQEGKAEGFDPGELTYDD